MKTEKKENFKKVKRETKGWRKRTKTKKKNEKLAKKFNTKLQIWRKMQTNEQQKRIMWRKSLKWERLIEERIKTVEKKVGMKEESKQKRTRIHDIKNKKKKVNVSK